MARPAVRTVHDPKERYELLAQIGRGGMGVVYEANDSRDGRSVALKFARDEADQAAACRQLAREAVALALPHDRHICAVYGLTTCAGKTCMVMERLVGRTLESRIAAGRLSTSEVLDIALQLVVALEAIHRVGLVHQDIKPANVFLTATGVVKVLDFGLAVAVGDRVARPVERGRRASPLVMGTPNYVAPERLSERPADSRSDLFSLGVVIYEMATGRAPFAAHTPQQVLSNVLSVDPVALRVLAPDRPATLERLVGKLLARDADDRYRSASEVKRVLQRMRTVGRAVRVGPAVVSGRSHTEIGTSKVVLRRRLRSPQRFHGWTGIVAPRQRIPLLAAAPSVPQPQASEATTKGLPCRLSSRKGRSRRDADYRREQTVLVYNA